MPVTVFTLKTRAWFDVSTRSRIFPEYYSLTISSSLLRFAAACWFVVQKFSQLISGRFKSPASITDGRSLQLR